MPRLLLAAAAALGALAFWRRKTLKDDTAKITESAKSGAAQVGTTAKEKASQIGERVRGESADEEADDAPDEDSTGEESGDAADDDTGSSTNTN